MPRKSSRQQRPSEIVMDEFAGERIPWDLDEHLNGCLAGYQTAPSYGAAVFFALEALWGIARDVGIRAEAGTLDPAKLPRLSPTTLSATSSPMLTAARPLRLRPRTRTPRPGMPTTATHRRIYLPKSWEARSQPLME